MWPEAKFWPKQLEIAQSVVSNRETWVRSGQACGKTFTAARLAIWFLSVYNPAIVITTAQTFRQVESILWGEIRLAYENARYDLGGQLLRTSWRIADDCYALGLSTDDPQKFQGHHAPHILVIYDEGGGIEDNIYEARNAIMTSEHSRFLTIGNPIIPSGRFYNAFQQGFDIPGRIQVSCLDAVRHGIKGLVTQEWIDEQKTEHDAGRNPFYYPRVLGEFPVESIDTVLSVGDVDLAFNNPVMPIEVIRPMIIACDPAFTGDDETIIQAWEGYRLIKQLNYNKKEPMETAGEIMQMKAQFRAGHCVIDEDGLGAGIGSRLREMGVDVISIRSASAGTGECLNLRASMWWSARELFKGRKVYLSKPIDNALRTQLLMPRYFRHSTGKIQIESKKDIKSARGVSPDRADCAIYALWAMKGLKQGIEESWGEGTGAMEDIAGVYSGGKAGW